MDNQASRRDIEIYRGHIPDYLAPALVLGWILTLGIFGVEQKTKWGRMVLPSWGGWRWLAKKILERVR
jgi:hypothetical protein